MLTYASDAASSLTTTTASPGFTPARFNSCTSACDFPFYILGKFCPVDERRCHAYSNIKDPFEGLQSSIFIREVASPSVLGLQDDFAQHHASIQHFMGSPSLRERKMLIDRRLNCSFFEQSNQFASSGSA